jgi:DNA helicase TIP49 (TBP-interacting protein)
MLWFTKKSVVFSGAHSHIRGLGLDDTLEARQVFFQFLGLVVRSPFTVT